MIRTIESLDYFLASHRGFRRIMKYFVDKKRNKFCEKEKQRRNEDTDNLMNFENKIFSQYGEDGIIQEIFSRIGTTDRFFVEFGAGDGQENNSRHLLENSQWKGLWIEGSDTACQKATKKFADKPIQVVSAFIDKDNIVDLFQSAQVPRKFDFLSIDIDGNDYWVAKEILKAYNPRVLCMEFNSSFPPPDKWIMPYNKEHTWDGTRYYGASLKAIEQLVEKFGYTLVGCESSGVNAFFLHTGCSLEKFSHINSGAEYHYTCPKYGSLFFGHPRGKGEWLPRNVDNVRNSE